MEAVRFSTPDSLEVYVAGSPLTRTQVSLAAATLSLFLQRLFFCHPWSWLAELRPSNRPAPARLAKPVRRQRLQQFFRKLVQPVNRSRRRRRVRPHQHPRRP